MNFIIRSCDYHTQEWYYQMGSEDTLPQSYAEFKEKLIDFITDNGLINCVKYNDETWTNYLERISLIAAQKSYSNDDVIKHLRSITAPRDLQTIL